MRNFSVDKPPHHEKVSSIEAEYIMYVFSRVWRHIRRDNHSKLRNFINSWEMAKTTIKRCKWLNWKTRDELLCAFAGMTSLTRDSKLCNFITWWELIKTPQNFIQGSFSTKSFEFCYKNWGRVFGLRSSLTHSFPMNPFSTHWKHQKTVRYILFLRFQKV